ncbi:CRISPR-associated ring nuclease Csm6 [Jhaorihella thermophila]
MPEPVPDTVLLVSVGLSPQVVTETLHALREAGKALPSRLILLTTRRGAEAVRDHLTDPVSGQIAAWGRAWDVAGADALAGRAEIVEIDSDSGDMDAARSLALFAAGAARLVRDLTSQPDVALHVSIAGGRKPAAAILGILMALHGRAQDRLSHVLVEPEGVVGSDFFFPSPQPRKLFGRDGRAIDASAVRIRLLELPFPRLGPNLRDGFDAPTAFEEAIRGADSAPRLVIDRSSSSLTWDGEGHVWPPMPLAFLSMVAEARIAGQGAYRGRKHRGRPFCVITAKCRARETSP